MSYLFDTIARYGDIIPLKYKLDYKKFEEGLELFGDKWVQYNPRKKIPRYGLSITSLDGGFSGRPDLDSLKEYNIEHNLNLDEPDFKTLTPIWPYVESVLSKFKNHLGRTHIIKMSAGGQFPSHRDHYDREIPTCRLFIPIYNCNPPFNYFILDDNLLRFDHGRLYFLNTCKEHIVFTSGRGGNQQSMFIVANLILTKESVDLVLHNMRSS